MAELASAGVVVCLHVASVAETPSTVLTNKRFLSCMSSHVDLQVSIVCKYFGAHITFIYLLFLCMSLHVRYESLERRALFRTHFTSQAVLRVIFQVFLELSFPEEYIITQFTWICLVKLYVSGKCPF